MDTTTAMVADSNNAVDRPLAVPAEPLV